MSLDTAESAPIQCIDNLLSITATSPPAASEIQFFEMSITNSTTYQVIVPQMQFNCHGTITSWSALAVLDATPSNLEHLAYKMTFTVWRPNRIEGSNLSEYDLVGYNTFKFETRELNNSISHINDPTVSEEFAFFHLTEKMVEPSEQITFRPGDVVGWNVHPRFQTIEPPLSVVYRSATAGEQGMDIKSTSFISPSLVWCSVSECTDYVIVQDSIIPYLSPQYGK